MTAAQRIWVTNQLQTPAARTRGLLNAEEDHGGEGRVGDLLLVIRDQIRSRIASAGFPKCSPLGKRIPSAPVFVIPEVFALTRALIRYRYGYPHLLVLQVVKVLSPLAISHDSAADNGTL